MDWQALALIFVLVLIGIGGTVAAMAIGVIFKRPARLLRRCGSARPERPKTVLCHLP